MREITKAEYLAHNVKDRSSPLTTEIRWFERSNLLGVLLRDNVDKDWSFVALAQDGDEWKAFDLGVSHPTPDAALTALNIALQRGP